MRLSAAILLVALSAATKGQDLGGHALFVRTLDADSGKRNALCEPLHLPLAEEEQRERERKREREREKGGQYNAMMYT